MSGGPSKSFCMIYYYVPEDLDDPDVPNVFGYFSLIF